MPFPEPLFWTFQQLSINTWSVLNIAFDFDPTMDLLGRKQLLCKLSHNHCLRSLIFRDNGPSIASFSFIFGLIKQPNNSIRLLLQINVKKCPSSIQYRDLNPPPRPIQHESSPITTIPRPPTLVHLMLPVWLGRGGIGFDSPQYKIGITNVNRYN